MKALITGGAGFIGSHLCEYMLCKGDEVIVIDNLSTGRHENIKKFEENKEFTFIFGDILDKKSFDDPSLYDIDIIIHLAAAVGVKYIIENPVKSIKTNVKGTEIILEFANSKNIPVFIASTSEVYGKNTHIPLKEDDDRVSGSTGVSRWSYACSKALDEFLSLAYYHEKKLPVIIGRFFNTCGPRQLGDYGMVIPKFVRNALLDLPIPIYGDGSQIRCFTHVKDVIKAIYSLINKKECYGQVFNIGSDIPITISELATLIINLTDSKSEIEYIPYNKVYGKNFEDMMVRQPSLEKIKKYIGFEYKADIKNILNDIIKHMKENDL
ncbi:MAG: nucleoside-diphosphate sugar epimerase [Candidatus Muiribacterium halophilum]|uniref:UDP-glucuronate decarboxylase n=1 Tax=Muiribacterium halophilum TaxID=2053465 RepID=A0A2N5ZAY6_MUIH1|nr:MAG: nucleoside-diphosphate sugar epimerase [Candidatus Muirbacterium halophilum]